MPGPGGGQVEVGGGHHDTKASTQSEVLRPEAPIHHRTGCERHGHSPSPDWKETTRHTPYF